MITGRQIRAARALLDWDASVLAEKAGLTRATVGRVEAALVQPQESTLISIAHVFDAHGIEFLDDDGVRMRKNQVRVFSGKVGYRQFLEHVYDTMKVSGGKIRQFNINDDLFLSYADDYVEVYLSNMEKIQNLDARVLGVEGEGGFPASYCTYRWLDKANRVLIPYYVYNDYLAMPLYSGDRDVEIISIYSKLLSARYVEQFDVFWDNALIPGNKRGKK